MNWKDDFKAEPLAHIVFALLAVAIMIAGYNA